MSCISALAKKGVPPTILHFILALLKASSKILDAADILYSIHMSEYESPFLRRACTYCITLAASCWGVLALETIIGEPL